MLETDFIPAAQKDSRYLMVVLHGLGDSMDGYRWLPGMLSIPWLNYLLVNAPDHYYGGFSWYDFGGDPSPGIKRSREALFALLDAQRSKGFPTEQTLMLGFSQGCLMTFEVGMRYPNLFAGLVGISGYVHQPEALLSEKSQVALKQRFLVTHGTQDTLIPLKPVEAQIDFLRAGGVQIDWRVFAKAHTIAGQTELSVIRGFIEKCTATLRSLDAA